MVYDKRDYLRRGGDPLWEAWLTLNESYNAWRYGFLANRKPTPGKCIDPCCVQRDMERIEYEWTKERNERHAVEFSGGLPVTDWPTDAQAWLHETLEGIRATYKEKK